VTVFNDHVMNVYGGVEVQLYAFLTLALDWRKMYPEWHWIAHHAVPRSGREAVEKKTFSYFWRESNHEFSVVRQVA
jgi:hypothetical protein